MNSHVSANAFPALFAAIVVIFLAAFVYVKGAKNSLHRSFTYWLLALFGWHVGTLLTYFANEQHEAIAAIRLSHVGIILIPATFLHFVLNYIGTGPKKTLVIGASYLLSGFYEILNWTPYFLGSASRRLVSYYGDGGVIYSSFLLYFFAVVFYCHIVLWFHIVNSKGIRRNQTKYLFLGSVVGYGGGAVDFLPIYGFNILPVGNAVNIFFVGTVAYAILVHRLFDIEVIIKKTLVFAGLFAAVLMPIALTVYVCLVLIMGIPFHLILKWWWLFCLGAATTAVTARRAERFLVTVTDKYLFQKKFDYRRILKAASEGLATINSLDHQLRLVVHFLTMRVRIRSSAIYMSENGSKNYLLTAARPSKSITHSKQIEYDSPILLYLKAERKKAFLEYYSLEEEARKYAKKPTYSYDLPRMLEEMKRLHARLIVPSFFQGEIQGMLILGEKKSEEPYNDEDVALFQTIAQESAIAFENARKHDKLVAQKEELTTANEKLKEAQAEIIQAKEEAAVAELSGGISHDVNNGIYAMSDANERAEEALNGLWTAFKDVYNSNQPISAPQKIELFDYLESTMVAVNQNKEAAKHIEDVARTLSQIAKGERAQMARLNVRTFIKGMVRIGALRTYTNRLKAQAFEEEPAVDIPNDVPPIYAHAQLLKAVFVNLFKNAIDAMDNVFPKKLKIKARRDSEDPEMVRVDFSDNGCGISKEHLPRIFDYEFTTKGSFGEGKGLFNVKTIIENQHQGKVEVESELGKGTTFILKIPIYKGQDLKDFEK